MKLRTMFYTLLLITLSTASLQAAPSTASVTDLDLFLQPLRMTATGLNCFFTQLYNSKRYTEDFFPSNFSHLAQFLEHGKQTNQSRDYTKATLSLFSQKLKGCLYVSAYSFNEFLAQLPTLLESSFPLQERIHTSQKKDALKQLLYQEFLTNFATFKDNPPAFFDSLSDTILQTIDPDAGQPISTEALRHSVIRFIEVGLGKLLWDPTDKGVWNNVKSIADHLNQLAEHQIISNLDDLNDLYWSLVHRLCYFIDITGSELPLEFYEDVRQDLISHSHTLLTLEEQEELAESKVRVLERIVMEGVAKKTAQQYGILAEEISV